METTGCRESCFGVGSEQTAREIRFGRVLKSRKLIETCIGFFSISKAIANAPTLNFSLCLLASSYVWLS